MLPTGHLHLETAPSDEILRVLRLNANVEVPPNLIPQPIFSRPAHAHPCLIAHAVIGCAALCDAGYSFGTPDAADR